MTEERVDEFGAFENDSAATEAGPGVEDTDAPEHPRRRFGLPRALRSKSLIVAVLLVLTLISGGAATWVYFKQYRPDQQTDAGVARAVVSAASDGTVAVMSYSPDTLDKDFAAARSHLTGNFLSYYNQLTQQMMSPAARQKSIKTSAHVMRAAVKDIHPDSAVVLVFVDQNTSIKDSPDSTMTPSSVLVSMARVNGNWLITEFEPV